MSIVKKCTLFCDIDGTLFHYRKFATYKTTNPTLVNSTIDRINSAYDNGHTIVLTTARPDYLRIHTMKELNYANVQYHQLVMGICRGARILINDNERNNIDRTFAINIARNKGFNEKQLEQLSCLLDN